MAKNYYAEESDIQLACSISGSTMTVHLASPSVYEEDAGLRVRNGTVSSVVPTDPTYLELCQGTPVSNPQLACGDTIIEVNRDDSSYSMGFGSLESGWTFVFEKYSGGTWESIGTSYPIPLPGGSTDRWRIKATQTGYGPVTFDPYIKGTSDCIDEPS